MADGYVGRGQGYIADQTELLQVVVDGLGIYNQTAPEIIPEFSADQYNQTARVSQAPISFNPHADGGVPESQRQSYRLLNFPLSAWDAGAPFTVIGLQDALPSDIQATMDAVMAGDIERQEAEFFRAVFTPQTATVVGTAATAGFYNSELDVPNFRNNTFAGTAHKHYKGLNTTTLALSHLQEAKRNIQEHGYGLGRNSLVAYFHTDQQDDVENLLNITVASSLTTPQRVTAQDDGGYGTGLMFSGVEIRFNDNTPSGYFTMMDRTVKPVARRLHVNPAYRGLQMYRQTFNENFPLAGTTFLSRYGFAVRHLGAGVAYQLVSSTSYTSPTLRLGA